MVSRVQNIVYEPLTWGPKWAFCVLFLKINSMWCLDLKDKLATNTFWIVTIKAMTITWSDCCSYHSKENLMLSETRMWCNGFVMVYASNKQTQNFYQKIKTFILSLALDYGRKWEQTICTISLNLHVLLPFHQKFSFIAELPWFRSFFFLRLEDTRHWGQI